MSSLAVQPPSRTRARESEARPEATRVRAAITGVGLVTPLGQDASTTWDALLAGAFITDHSRVDDGTAHDAGPRVTRLAIRAAREAIASAGRGADELCDAALVVGTSKGPVEAFMIAPPGLSDVRGLVSPPGLADLAYGIARAMACADRPPAGPRLTVSAACASGIHALIRGAMLILSGEATRVLVVAAEASVHPLFLGSFQRLGVLPKPGIGCRPFDAARDGFLMSDAAAAVCLEASKPSAGGSPDDPGPVSGRVPDRSLATIDRFALGADATHLTGGDPSATVLRRLLARVVDGRPVDLIHAHGTGTVANDPTELAAIEAVVSADTQPIVYSHKGALGHSLGAAGLVSVVLNCLAARERTIPPNVRTTRPLPTRGVILAQDARPASVRRSVAIAAGFGGAVGVVTLNHT